MPNQPDYRELFQVMAILIPEHKLGVRIQVPQEMSEEPMNLPQQEEHTSRDR
jgi:hypothetical protein